LLFANLQLEESLKLQAERVFSRSVQKRDGTGEGDLRFSYLPFTIGRKLQVSSLKRQGRNGLFINPSILQSFK